jgi:hypothetical protein
MWGAVRRKIEEEIGIPPDARKECRTFMKYLRQDINQVSVEGNAKIPEFIKTKCFDKFSRIPNFVLPEICGEMEHTSVYNKKQDAVADEIAIIVNPCKNGLSMNP